MDKTVLLNEAKQFLDQLMSKVNIVKQIFYPPQNNRPNYIVNDGRPLLVINSQRKDQEEIPIIEKETLQYILS